MFAPGALRLRVQVTVENDGEGDSFGNGTHAAFVENDDYVYGAYEDGELAITYRFPFQGGTGTVTIDIAADEYPPTPEHDLDATEACDDPEGLVLDGSYVLSTDPDNDIVADLWYIDGALCGSECILPFGAHQVMLEAQDARGAVQRTAPEWVYVATGCSIG